MRNHAAGVRMRRGEGVRGVCDERTVRGSLLRYRDASAPVKEHLQIRAMRDDNLSIDVVDDIYSQKLKLKVFKLTFECSFFSLFFLLHNLCLEKNNNVPR